MHVKEEARLLVTGKIARDGHDSSFGQDLLELVDGDEQAESGALP